MQKLPEASDRNRSDDKRPLTRKGTVPTKGGSSLSFQKRPAECQHLANWWRTLCVRFLDDSFANPSTGSNRLFRYQPMTNTRFRRTTKSD